MFDYIEYLKNNNYYLQENLIELFRCTVPYNAVYDSNGDLWVASKGTLSNKFYKNFRAVTSNIILKILVNSIMFLFSDIYKILGGLFKICGQKNHSLWAQKNDFPKRQAAYSQVATYNDSIVYTMADDNSKLTEFRILDLNGNKKHEQFIDGLVQVNYLSFTISFTIFLFDLL